MTIEQRQEAGRCEFWLDGTQIGHVYPTRHPTIPYEAFVLLPGEGDIRKSKRVNNTGEAQEWVRTMWASSKFDQWWRTVGRFLDPDTSDVPWFDKRKSLAQSAFVAALVPSAARTGGT